MGFTGRLPINAVLKGQMTGASQETNADVVLVWNTAIPQYLKAVKADKTGDSAKDGKWFDDFLSWSPSSITLTPGSGFLLINRQVVTQQCFLAGEVVLEPEETELTLPFGLSLFSFPYSSAGTLDGLDRNDRITRADGQAVERSLNLGEGYWYLRRAMDATIWKTKRPYSNPFPIPPNDGPPRVLSITPAADGGSITLGIRASGEAGERLDIFCQDLSSPTNTFCAERGWRLLCESLDTKGKTEISWTDPLAGGFPFARCYVVARADMDLDGDGIPDARERFVSETDSNGRADGGGGRRMAAIPTGLAAPVGTLSQNVTLTWDGLGNGNWSEPRWLGGPPAYPGATEDAIVRQVNNKVTVDGARFVSALQIYSNAIVEVANGCSLTSYSILVSNGWLSAVSGGYVASDNTNRTAGAFAYELYAGTNSAPLGGVNASLRKYGTGLFWLQGQNTYGGRSQLDAGVLIAQDGAGLSPNSQLYFNGGILGGMGSFTRAVGTGAGQVYWNNNGGFAARGGNLVVSLNGGAAVDWSSAVAGLNGKTLFLNCATADGTVDLQNALNLKGNRTVHVDDNTATFNDFSRIAGIIANGDATARSLTKTGTGWLELSGANTFSGGLYINGGYLRGVDGVNIPAAGLLQLNGGVLESHGTFARGSGNAAGKVYWYGNGGFAAQGGPLAITLDSGAPLTWGLASYGFNGKTLIMGSALADNVVSIGNPILLQGSRTVQVDDNTNSVADAARFTGVISDGDTTPRSLTKTGAGVLELTGGNLFSGGLIVSAGSLRAVDGVGLPAAGLLQLNGGVLESRGAFTRASGNAAGKVYWNNNGGFAAQGGALTVMLDGGATLNWGVASGGFNAKTLILNSVNADNVVDLTNPIGLLGNRTVQVNDNPFNANDCARFSGGIANGDATARSLTKTGNGLLELTGNNTFSGGMTVSAGELRVNGAVVSSAVTVSGAGTRLSGVGLVKGFTINTNAILAPGNGAGSSVGTLVSTNNVSIANGGIYEWELAPTTYDSVSVTGNVTLTAGWKLRFKDAGGTAAPGNKHVLFRYAGTATLGACTLDGSLVSGPNWNYSGATVLNDTVAKCVYVTGLSVGTPIQDRDGDGLPDWWELWYFGSTAAQSGGGDFDNDGLSNAGELAQGTSPANPDTDGDGVIDGVEQQRGTDPLNPVNNTGTLTWDGAGNGNWSASRWLGGPPAYPGATENAIVRKLNNKVTVDGARMVNVLQIYSNSTVEVADGGSLSPYSVVVSNAWLSSVGSGAIASENGSITSGRFAYEMYLGTNTAPLGGSRAALRKFGTGLFNLGGQNTYGGRTQIDAGVLMARNGSLPAGSAIYFNGGILAAAGTLNRTIGTGTGQVCWNGNGGFAAWGGNLVVNLNGGAALDWSSAAAGLNGKTLFLNSTVADGLVEFQSALDLKANRTVQVDDNTATLGDFARIAGIIANGDATARSLTKTGAGWLELSGANTFSGGLYINGGYLRGVDGVNIPAAGLLQLSGAVLESRGTFARASGNAAGNVYWYGNGGFAAQGGPLCVTLDYGTNLNWGAATAGFNAKTLIMGSALADDVVTLSNPIGLYANRTIQVDNNTNSAADVARLDGVISDGDATPRSLTKTGAGVLELTGGNTFSGGLIVTLGSVRGVDGVGLPTAGVLQINGGVVESQGAFTRASGNAAGKVYWNNNGGFAAVGGPLTVTLDYGTNLNWGAATAGFNAKTLILNSVNADNVVTLSNPIGLYATRTIQVDDNPFNTNDYARLSGVIANGDASARALTKTGAGLLELTAVNTYSGATTVNGGDLRVNGNLPNSAATVNNAGSRLSGYGWVKGVTINANAALAPGSGSPGTLYSSGNLSIANGGIYEWRLGATSSDKVEVTGNVTLSSTWKLRFKDAGGSAVPSDQFTLFKYTGTASVGSYVLDTSALPAENCYWDVSGATVVNDTVGKRVYVTGLLVYGPHTDTDQDGMPDWWEIKYFGYHIWQQPYGDADGDGVCNVDEYGEGTDPYHSLRLRDVGGTDATVVWNVPLSTEGKLAYQVTLKQGSSTILSAVVTECNYHFGNLWPGMAYECSVTATNAANRPVWTQVLAWTQPAFGNGSGAPLDGGILSREDLTRWYLFPRMAPQPWRGQANVSLLSWTSQIHPLFGWERFWVSSGTNGAGPLNLQGLKLFVNNVGYEDVAGCPEITQSIVDGGNLIELRTTGAGTIGIPAAIHLLRWSPGANLRFQSIGEDGRSYVPVSPATNLEVWLTSAPIVQGSGSVDVYLASSRDQNEVAYMDIEAAMGGEWKDSARISVMPPCTNIVPVRGGIPYWNTGDPGAAYVRACADYSLQREVGRKYTTVFSASIRRPLPQVVVDCKGNTVVWQSNVFGVSLLPEGLGPDGQGRLDFTANGQPLMTLDRQYSVTDYAVAGSEQTTNFLAQTVPDVADGWKAVARWTVQGIAAVDEAPAGSHVTRVAPSVIPSHGYVGISDTLILTNEFAGRSGPVDWLIITSPSGGDADLQVLPSALTP